MWDNNRKARGIIVDDHPLVIEGFKNVIQGNNSLELCGQFGTAEALKKFAGLAEIDLVLLDITLPDGNGLQICKELKQTYPNLVILAISNLSERSIIKQMLQRGASGYLLKTADAEDILICMLAAIQGKIALSREVKATFDISSLTEQEEIPELTNREKQILKLLAQGKRSAEIADELFISPLTVKTHRATLLHKFGTDNIVIAINKAREIGILSK